MAARQALGRALLAAGGTMVVLTVGTGALSGVAMGVAKVFIDREKVGRWGQASKGDR